MTIFIVVLLRIDKRWMTDIHCGKNVCYNVGVSKGSLSYQFPQGVLIFAERVLYVCGNPKRPEEAVRVPVAGDNRWLWSTGHKFWTGLRNSGTSRSTDWIYICVALTIILRVLSHEWWLSLYLVHKWFSFMDFVRFISIQMELEVILTSEFSMYHRKVVHIFWYWFYDPWLH